MNLKQMIAAATLAGAFSAAALGMGAGLANAAPGSPPPAPAGGHGAPAPGGIHAPTGPNDPGWTWRSRRTRRPGRTRRTWWPRVAPVDMARAVPAAPRPRWTWWPGRTWRPRWTRLTANGPVARVAQADPAVRGTAMLSVATSTEPRGAKDPLLGATVSHLGRRGIDRSRRQEVTGIRPDQLLGLPGNTRVESRFQPVGLRLLRSLDPAVNS